MSLIYRICFLLRYLATGLFVVFLLSSCSPSIRGAPNQTFTTEQDISAFKSGSGSGAIKRYLASGSPSEKRALRNNIVLSRLFIIDKNYSSFERNLTKERQGLGFYSAIALLGLNSVGTLVGGSETKAILHAISAGLTGAKESYSKEILIEKTIDILQKNMRARRLEIQGDIFASLEKSVFKYPLQLAMSDLEKYYTAGSITGAFLGASNLASAQLEVAEVEAQIAKGNFFQRTDTGDQIKSYIKISTRNRDRVIKWLGKNAGGIPWAIFVKSAQYEHLHHKIIDDLSIS